MCQKHLWHGTYELFGIDRIDEWIYCSHSRDDQPCRRTYIHDHGDINMAPQRLRSVSYDLPFGARIIERKPESEVGDSPLSKTRRRPKKLTLGFKFRDLFRPTRTRSILRRRPVSDPEPEPEIVGSAYVETREPRQPRARPVSPRTPPPEQYVPLPSPVPSPRHRPGGEARIAQIRSPRMDPIIHAPSPPVRVRRRRSTRSPSPEVVREVETIRVRRFEQTDRGRAQRQRERDVEQEARIERERRHNAEVDNHRLSATAQRERSERRAAETEAAALRQENELLDRERRLAEREAAVRDRDRERERERERAREREREQERRERERGHAADILPPARGASQYTREIPTDRGADVIRAAQNAGRHRRGERITYYENGRRVQEDRYL